MPSYIVNIRYLVEAPSKKKAVATVAPKIENFDQAILTFDVEAKKV